MIEVAVFAICIGVLVQSILLYRLSNQLDRIEDMIGNAAISASETSEMCRLISTRIAKDQGPISFRVPWGLHQ